MKLDSELLKNIKEENIHDEMIESFKMGSGLKDKIIYQLFNGEDISIPSPIESHIHNHLEIWHQQNLKRKQNKKHVA
jgi:hypothetical protein